METQLPFPKMGHSPPIFGPCLLSPNGWMDQDETWYAGRPHPWQIVLDGDPSPSPPKKHSPPIGPCLLWHNCCMHQVTTWYGGRPQPMRHCVRRGPSSPTPLHYGHSSPLFGPCLLWPRSPISATPKLLFNFFKLNSVALQNVFQKFRPIV